MAGDWGFLVFVRGWLSWLLVFGVIAGLCGRVLALDHVHPEKDAAHCCGHGHVPDHGEDPTPDCPPGPHDHHAHACCHPAPLAGMEVRPHRLALPDHVLLGVSWPGALPPEEPVFALDKPPLI